MTIPHNTDSWISARRHHVNFGTIVPFDLLDRLRIEVSTDLNIAGDECVGPRNSIGDSKCLYFVEVRPITEIVGISLPDRTHARDKFFNCKRASRIGFLKVFPFSAILNDVEVKSTQDRSKISIG